MLPLGGWSFGLSRLAGRAFRGERVLSAVADLYGAAHALSFDFRDHADVDRAPTVSRLERELDSDVRL